MTSIASKFGHKPNEIPKPDPLLAIPDARVGIEVEVEGYRTHPNNLPHNWESKQDHSLRNGREFVTNGGMVGTQILPAIDAICAFAIKQKYSPGYPRAGIHIHLDCTDLNSGNDKDLWALWQVYVLVEHMMFAKCAEVVPEEKSEWRRWCAYCDGFDDSRGDYEVLAKVLMDWRNLTKASVTGLLNGTSKYQAVNFIPLITLGTVEFRHLPTTFDAALIKEWVNVILAIKKAAKEVVAKDDFDMCSEFSKRGPRNLILHLLGEWIRPYMKYLDERKCWKAIDAIQAMQGHVNANARVLGWQEPDNPILLSKIRAQDEKPAAPKKAAPELRIQPPPRAQPANQRARAMPEARFLPEANPPRRENAFEQLWFDENLINRVRGDGGPF